MGKYIKSFTFNFIILFVVDIWVTLRGGIDVVNSVIFASVASLSIVLIRRLIERLRN